MDSYRCPYKAESTTDRLRRSLDEVGGAAAMGISYSAVVELATSAAVIGMARLDGVMYGVRASLVMWVGHARPERGCGREATGALVAWGFDQLALRVILAEVFGSNPRIHFDARRPRLRREWHRGSRYAARPAVGHEVFAQS